MNIAGLVYLLIMALVIGFIIYSRVKQNKEIFKLIKSRVRKL